MPEFEEKHSQPNPEHSYTPSASAPPKNKGGRRRSGGFKSTAAASPSKIGEVDPTEVLKTEVRKSPSQSDDAPDTQASCSIKSSKTSRSSCSLKKTKESTDVKPQPSKATLDSIKKVEERIAKRRAESEKSCSDRDKRSSKNRGSQIQKDEKKALKGGLLAAIGQFFGTLLGSSSESSSTKDRERPPQKRRPQSNDRDRSNGSRKNDPNNKRKNQRGGQRRRRKSASQNT